MSDPLAGEPPSVESWAQSSLRLRDTMTLLALAAVVAAAWHVSYSAWRVFVEHDIVGASRELPWFSPLSYLFCFSLLALPLVLLGWRIRAFRSAQVQGTVFASAAAFAILINLTAVYTGALTLLAVGIGVQAGRLLGRNVPAGMRRARRLTLLLASLLFVAGIPGIVLYRWRMNSALASLPAAPAEAPNVILLILDTVRAANLSLYGYQRATTPELERLGADGVVFDAAMSTAPWTAPSHATLLTGRYPFFTGISYGQQMTDSVTTLTEVMKEHGYATGAFMGNALYAGRVTGFDRGFIRYDDFPVSIWQGLWSGTIPQLQISQRIIEAIRKGELWRLRRSLLRAEVRIDKVNKSDRFTGDAVIDRFLGWQRDIGARPFFAMINLFDAHNPYETPMQSRFDGGRRAMDRYDGAIAFTDSVIGVMARELQARGVLDRTILVVTSDHGEQFGEHGLTRHGNSLYLELLRVPLMIRAPGRAAEGRHLQQVVSLRDVPATILDLTGLSDPRIQGTSLAPRWRDSEEAGASLAIAEAVHPPNQSQNWPTARGPMKSLVTDEFHYIRRGDGEERVFLWSSDTTGRGDQTATALGQRAIDTSRAAIRAQLGARWQEFAPR